MWLPAPSRSLPGVRRPRTARAPALVVVAMSALDLEVDRGDQRVEHHQQHESEDNGLVDRFTHALGAALGVHPQEAGDQRGPDPEDHGIDEADYKLREAGRTEEQQSELQS